ncbi:hypothetical protein [uncultured Tateyamaria sp.]|uniref:hypothetical protein n=1 Tax=uncultured Tateyamaria sp. TaxID=455651 RepID=UPI00261DFBB2|nr:hypothetical protein [uncultured Tateyamaria sp.]
MRKQYHTRAVGADRHVWDIHRLVRIARTLTAHPVPLSEISELDELWWFQTEDDVPTPRAVAAHMALVEQADLQYPILLCSEGRLMDGMHRVVKAVLEGRETIQAIRFPSTPDPDYVNVDLNDLCYPDEDV